MKEELVSSIAGILREWNPLGEAAESTLELEGYKYEAMDILAVLNITKVPVSKAVYNVLTQAFGITLNEAETEYYSAKIEKLLRTK